MITATENWALRAAVRSIRIEEPQAGVARTRAPREVDHGAVRAFLRQRGAALSARRAPIDRTKIRALEAE
eukprot:7377237-Prymnesium_polylepis.1